MNQLQLPLLDMNMYFMKIFRITRALEKRRIREGERKEQRRKKITSPLSLQCCCPIPFPNICHFFIFICFRFFFWLSPRTNSFFFLFISVSQPESAQNWCFWPSHTYNYGRLFIFHGVDASMHYIIICYMLCIFNFTFVLN